MTQGEKLEEAKRLYKDANADQRYVLEKLFPELKESEESERIRKTLIKYFRNCISLEGINGEDISNWLEKQGGQKEYTFKSLPRLLDMIEPTSRAKVYCQKLMNALVKEGYSTDAKIVGECLKKMNGEDVPMVIMDEKQGEQKSFDYENANIQQKDFAPKVEQKPDLEKGKWYVCDTSRYTDFVVGKAYLCPKNGMLKPNENEMARYVARNCFHLWTIQDATDGDVLVDKSGGKECPFIFKEAKPSNIKTDMLQPLTILGYCGIGGAGFTKGSGWGDTVNCTYYPANKKQRNLLFQKMHEEGYEWDTEKKELNKIEQKTAEWSENDEKRIKNILSVLDVQMCWNGATGKKENPYQKEIDWLKSLKFYNRWKPNDEQMQALSNAGNSFRPFEEGHKILWSLYNDLKKLREE